ncbi:hypothetical protein D0856_28080 [Vibrio owensii]|nr:hypothetical protein D0856_28080 [Vibrio owensii]
MGLLNWHQESDLTTKTGLDDKTRPISQTQIVVNSLSDDDSHLWDTLLERKFVELVMGESASKLEVQ